MVTYRNSILYIILDTHGLLNVACRHNVPLDMEKPSENSGHFRKNGIFLQYIVMKCAIYVCIFERRIQCCTNKIKNSLFRIEKTFKHNILRCLGPVNYTIESFWMLGLEA